MTPRLALSVVCLLGALACLEAVSWVQHHFAPGPTRLLWSGLFSQGLWALAALGGGLAAEATPLRDRLGLHSSGWRRSSLLLAVLGFVAFSNGLYRILLDLGLRRTGALARIDEAVEAAATGPLLGLAVLAVGMAPGVCEELLFRGLLQRTVALRLGGPAAIVLASGAFALAHADVVHSSAAFCMGLYLGTAAHRAASIRPAMACHVANNCLGMAWAILGVGGGEAGIGAGLGMVALGASTLTLVCARERHEEDDAPRGDLRPEEGPGPGGSEAKPASSRGAEKPTQGASGTPVRGPEAPAHEVPSRRPSAR